MRDTLELLRLARILANIEYQEKRESMHHNWLTESNSRWSTDKTFVPYPSMPPFPSDQEVVDMARDLKIFMDSRRAGVTVVPEDDAVPAPPVIPQRPVAPVFPMEPLTIDPDRAEDVVESKKEPVADDTPTEEEVKTQSV